MAGISKRKRQTQLGFTPVPSSSPAAKGYPKQIQDRAAMVTFDGTSNPAKKRKIQNGVNDDVPKSLREETPLPTPAGTFDQNGKPTEISSDSDDMPVKSTQRRGGTFSTRRRKGKQQELKFGGAEDGAPGPSLNFSSPTTPRPSQRVFGMAKSKVNDNSSDESDELPSPKNMAAKTKADGKEKTGKKPKGRVTRSQKQPVTIESDDEEVAVQSKPQATEEEDDDDSEDAMPTTSGKQRRQRAQAAKEDDFVSSSPPRAIESDDEVQVIERPRKRKAKDDTEYQEEEEVEHDEPPKTPGRRKLQRPRRVLTQQEQEDLNEDLDFLVRSDEDSGSEKRAPRNTQSAAKTARLSALEKLKRKRTKQPNEPIVVEDEDEEEADDTLGYPDDGEDEDNEEVPDDNEEYDQDMYDQANVAPKPTSSRDFFREDEGDADFLVDEEGDNDLGVRQGIPLAFTRYASMKNKELFRFAVEFMVQKKINPAFQMDDEIYELTFRKLDDEVRGLAGSKFTSAAWTPEYTKQLRARPEIAIEEINRSNPEHFMRDHCDACNRSGHPATFEIQFQGKPYNRHTLEDVGGGNESDDDDDDDGSDSDSNPGGKPDPNDQPAYDAQGIEIAPANTIYYVGKFCKANSETAHSLQHWRYALNEFVITWLAGQGYSRAEKVVERDRWSTKKRRKEANRIVDRMEERGVVAGLWKEFRATVAAARDSKQGRY